MTLFCCRRNYCIKVAASCLLLVFLFKYFVNQPALQESSLHHVYGVGNPRGFLYSPGSTCLPGNYSKQELAPHLQRPLQDPRDPGASGKAFVMWKMSAKQLQEKLDLFKINQYNQFASDRMSMHRELGADTRHPDCLAQKFSRCPGLTTSVIIVFHNEAWSVLLRTVYSVLHTAPAVLLKEILLVDDASTQPHLKTRLDDYVEKLKIVRVLRLRKREGLVAARLMGTRAAQGKVLTFLDSHCECFPGWLEPLLARIAEEPTAVVSPNIAQIDFKNLKFIMPDPQKYTRGIFNWRLEFRWEKVPIEEILKRKNETCPIRTPTIAGGLFSISKSYFEHIGTYDDGMEFWGGENLEMSFRVWQCGGLLEIIPCSVVGHIFRKKAPHIYPKKSFTIARNMVRLAEVWLDDFKEVFFRTSQRAELIHRKNLYGNVSKRLELRQRLKCRDFKWYLNNVYPQGYMPDISPIKYGKLTNKGMACALNVMKRKMKWVPVRRLRCDNNSLSQLFEHTSMAEIRLIASNNLCLHAKSGRSRVSLEQCRLKGKGTRAATEQMWIVTHNNHLKNKALGKCLTVSKGKQVILASCSYKQVNQGWAFL